MFNLKNFYRSLVWFIRNLVTQFFWNYQAQLEDFVKIFFVMNDYIYIYIVNSKKYLNNFKVLKLKIIFEF